MERRRLKALAGELSRALEEVQARAEDIDGRQREAEVMKAEALAASETAAKEREAARLVSVRAEEAARRLDAERTSVAQAREERETERDSRKIVL